MVFAFTIPDTKLRGLAKSFLYFSSNIFLGIINSPLTTIPDSFGKSSTFNKWLISCPTAPSPRVYNLGVSPSVVYNPLTPSNLQDIT